MQTPPSFRARVWDPEGSRTLRQVRNGLSVAVLASFCGAVALAGGAIVSYTPIALVVFTVLSHLSLRRRCVERTIRVEGDSLRFYAGPIPVRTLKLTEIRSLLRKGKALVLTPDFPGAFSIVANCASEAEADQLQSAIATASPFRSSEVFLRLPSALPKLAASETARLLIIASMGVIAIGWPGVSALAILAGYATVFALLLATIGARFGLPERGQREQLEFDGKRALLRNVIAHVDASLPRGSVQAARGFGRGYYSGVGRTEKTLSNPTFQHGSWQIQADEGRVLFASVEIAETVASFMQRAEPTDDDLSGLPLRNEATLSTWFAQLDGIAAQAGAYRGAALAPPQLIALLEDASQTIEMRAGAARVLHRCASDALGLAMARIAPELGDRLRVAIENPPELAAAAFAASEDLREAKNRRFGP